MIFLSAGHFLQDPGAVANGSQENQLTIELRDLVVKHLISLGQVPGKNFKIDSDDWDLKTYISKLKTGSGSVIFEIHFDSSSNPKSTGTTMIIPYREWTKEKELELQFGKEVSLAVSSILQIKNRGVIDETASARKRLAIMRPEGINGLLEVGFISNTNDLKQYKEHKDLLALQIAKILIKYDSLRS